MANEFESDALRDEDLMDPEYITKCDEYRAYIDDHINNVKAAYEKLFRNAERPFTYFHGIIGERLEKMLGQLEMAIQCHDSTKYLDTEFEGYRVHFYPTSREEARKKSDPFYAQLIEANFNTAWFNHLTNNDHHPEHWKWIGFVDAKVPDMDNIVEGQPIPKKIVKQKVILKTPREIGLPMKPLAILHMICDWEAMSIKFGGSTPDWYINKAVDERKAFNPKTRAIVEELLKQLYGCEIPEVCAGDTIKSSID